jgi:hypothetical protein
VAVTWKLNEWAWTAFVELALVNTGFTFTTKLSEFDEPEPVTLASPPKVAETL